MPDRLTFGTGVVASFLARVLREPAIELRLEHRVTELLTDDDGAVVGVRAESPAGPVEARGPVVLATSTYDWDPELVQELVGLDPDDFGSVAPRHHPRRRHPARPLRRRRDRAAARHGVPMLPGWPTDTGVGYAYGPDYAMPHSMIVDPTGQPVLRRLLLGRHRREDDGPRRPPPAVLPRLRRAAPPKYGLGATPPGRGVPRRRWSPRRRPCASWPTALGIDGEQLTRTAEAFSENARQGLDPDFGRGTRDFVRRFAGDPANEPNPVLGPVEQAPFHGLRLRFVGTAIGTSGVRIDGDGRVLDEQGGRVAGLYAVGSCRRADDRGHRLQQRHRARSGPHPRLPGEQRAGRDPGGLTPRRRPSMNMNIIDLRHSSEGRAR